MTSKSTTITKNDSRLIIGNKSNDNNSNNNNNNNINMIDSLYLNSMGCLYIEAHLLIRPFYPVASLALKKAIPVNWPLKQLF